VNPLMTDDAQADIDFKAPRPACSPPAIACALFSVFLTIKESPML